MTRFVPVTATATNCPFPNTTDYHWFVAPGADTATLLLAEVSPIKCFIRIVFLLDSVLGSQGFSSLGDLQAVFPNSNRVINSVGNFLNLLVAPRKVKTFPKLCSMEKFLRM